MKSAVVQQYLLEIQKILKMKIMKLDGTLYFPYDNLGTAFYEAENLL